LTNIQALYNLKSSLMTFIFILHQPVGITAKRKK